MEDNQKEEIENEEDIPAPSASLMNLDLNLKQSKNEEILFYCSCHHVRCIAEC